MQMCRNKERSAGMPASIQEPFYILVGNTSGEGYRGTVCLQSLNPGPHSVNILYWFNNNSQREESLHCSCYISDNQLDSR